MIDKLFGAIEDIYFTVCQEPGQEDENTSTVVVFSSTNLNQKIEEFKQLATTQVYIGKSGNQFKLLKLATLFLNYIMHEDDGVFSEDEKNVLHQYIKSKLSRLTTDQKTELKSVFDVQIELPYLRSYILDNELPFRSIDMILDKIIDHTKNQPRYFKPFEDIYSMLIGELNVQ